MQAKTNHNRTANNRGKRKRDYAVSGSTAALLDCIAQASNLFEAIANALALYYGEEAAEQIALPYLNAINGIADQLHNEMQTQISEHLGDLQNLNGETTHI